MREKVSPASDHIVSHDGCHCVQVLYIADVVNKPDHVPRNPSAENLSNVFDTRFPTVQPYLHRVSHVSSGAQKVPVPPPPTILSL